MKIISPRTNKDIMDCITMYQAINDESFFEIDIERSFKYLHHEASLRHFFRIVIEEEKPIAWIYCNKSQLFHQREPIFQQMYFCTNQKGIKAYRCVKLLHEAMCEEAARLGINECLSMSSHMDPDFTFARILEKLGWERRGYAALKHL